MVTHFHRSLLLTLARCCRSKPSTKRDSTVYPINEVESSEVEAFNEKVTQMFHNLALVESNELLSVSWISKLLAGFQSCQEQFRVLLSKNKACLNKHGLETSLSDYFERSVKSLDVCNAIRDGIEEIKLWRNQIETALRVLNDQKKLGEAQILRAKRALNDLEMKINDGKESGSNFAQRNHSFNMKKLRYQESEALTHSKSFTWSVSRSWSASKQLQVIGNNVMVPKRSEIIATNGLVLAIYTMSHVLHFVMWALVAAIPCQGRGLQSPFCITSNFAWGVSILSLQERILNEYKKRDRRNNCGLLKEIHGIGKYTRYMNELTNSTRFPLEEEQEGEMKKRIEKLRIVYKSLKIGLDPLERQVREVFLGIVRCRMEELDVLARPHD
ncbi:BYPASS-related protein [Tanacetum coccineum]|uniref:BYPASS-related protein n=1 Tax=Tanacetum coccineum TaxID=301880 RepID=A0ABQ5IJF2_9ASTR